jgi:hypothetical protein
MTASATSIGTSEASRSGQVRVGFAADGRLDACPALIVCCPSARSRSRTRQHDMPVCRYFCGSDGLEPATSGLTGLFHTYHDWRRLPRYRSIDAGLPR